MGRHVEFEERLADMDRRVPDATPDGPSLLDELAKIRDPQARDLITTACVVLVDPDTDPEQRSLAARWSSVEYRPDLSVADLQAMVDYQLTWPSWWPAELRVIRTVHDYFAEMHRRAGTY